MKKYEKIEHSIDSFGIREVSHGQIRFDLLETRINPKIPFPHKHRFYQVLLITQGSGNHTIDFLTHKVLPKSLFIMKPGQMHSWNFKPGTKGIILEFNRESVSFFEGNHLLNEFDHCVDSVLLENKNFKHLSQLYINAINSYEKDNRFQELCLKAHLAIILTAILQISGISADVIKINSTASQFKILMEQHFKIHHEVDFYAGLMHMNSKNLSMQITRSLGKSPRQLIQDRIILEAKRHLIYSSDSIGAIAEVLGFEDQNYFSRFFKKHEKTTPRNFRELVHKKS